MIVYNIGNLLSFIVYVKALYPAFSCFQPRADLHDPQQVHENDDDHDDEQYVDGIARTRKAGKKIRAEVSYQP